MGLPKKESRWIAIDVQEAKKIEQQLIEKAGLSGI